MLIPPKHLRIFWGLKPRVIVHVGGHFAEELGEYVANGWGTSRVIWIEALPEAVAEISRRISGFPEHSVYQGLMWSEGDLPITFTKMSNGESSSALAPARHLDVYRDIVPVEELTLRSQTLSSVLLEAKCREIDLLNIDVQGAELHVLQGLGEGISRVRAIYMEINTSEMYRGCALLGETDEWLRARGFARVDDVILPEGWGDALYLPLGGSPMRRALAGRLRRLFISGRRTLGRARRVVISDS